MWCLNAETGKVVWKHSCSWQEKVPYAPPTVDEGYVYALSAKGLLLRLDANRGKLRLKKDPVNDSTTTKPYYGFAGSPVIEDDLIILTANTADLALNKHTEG